MKQIKANFGFLEQVYSWPDVVEPEIEMETLGFKTVDREIDIGAHMWSEIRNLICSRNLFRSAVVANMKLISKRDLFPLPRAQRVLSYRFIQNWWRIY